MTNVLLRRFGGHFAHKLVVKHTEEGGVLDVRFGLALLRDRRIPIGAKLMSLAIGGGITAAVMAMELPLESLLALLVPFIGFASDALIDGLEAVIGPMVVAALVLPHLAPEATVRALREERALLH